MNTLENTSHFKPKIWIVALLAIFNPPSALLYVGRLRTAFYYLLIGLILIYSFTVFLHDEAAKAFVGFLYAFLCGAHAYHITTGSSEGITKPIFSRGYWIVGFNVLILSTIVAIRAFGLESFRIKSNSMNPNLRPADTVLVKKWGYGHYSAYGINWIRTKISTPLRRGEILVFEFPPDRRSIYLQRLIGLPGDVIEYKDKVLSINGIAVATTKLGEKTVQTSHDDQQEFETYEEIIDGQAIRTQRYTQVAPASMMAPPFQYAENCRYDFTGFKCKVPNNHYFVLGDNRDDSLDSRYWGFIPEDHILGVVSEIIH